jgi:carbamoyltransferase
VSRASGSTYVLGTGLSHDGSACLLKDGEICVAIEKERITRLKHDGGNDSAAITYCLDAAGITIDDVALIVQNANFGMMTHGNDWWGGARVIPADANVCTISHHLAHAYSAIGTCPFDDTAVLIVDGCGNAYDECLDLGGAVVPDVPADPELRQLCFEKDSYYTYANGTLRPVFKDFSPWGLSHRHYPMHPPTTRHSIGGVYLAVSMYVFSGFEDPGKLMGLAPYGRPGVYDFEIFDLRDGRVFVRYDWMERFQRPARDDRALRDDFSYYADIAWWVQREVERALLYVFNSRYEMAPCDSVAYAGGVALNAVANARLLRETPFRHLYMQPASADNGLAIGCAFYGWLEVLKRERRRHGGSTCFGRGYGAAESIPAAFEAYGDRVDVSEHDSESGDHVEVAAEALANGQVVAWFQGGAEFGPRALGHRSILADPERPDVRNFINTEIKRREDFRPFAPSVVAEEVSTYFDCTHESPYMILVAPVRDEWRARLQSVVHVDGSARIQTVTTTLDPSYHALLMRFKARRGFAVLLNTSFNRRRMPIVETPAEALAFFLESPLDLLVIDRFVIRKKAEQRATRGNLAMYFSEEMPRALAAHAAAARAMGGVYQVKVRGTRAWTIDLTQTMPRVIEGVDGLRPDLTIELAEDDMRLLLSNPLGEGPRLMTQSRVQVEGDRRKLETLARLLDIR